MAKEEEAPKKLSRRQFVKGAAVGAAGAAAVGALASCAPAATPVPTTAPGETPAPAATCPPAAECAPCPTVTVQEALPEEPAEVQPIPPMDPPAAWDKEADIVVVGGGGGGLAAAVMAADKGSSVIVLEKMASPGGATKYSGGCDAYGTRVQEAGGYIWTEEEFEKIRTSYMISSGRTVSEALLDTLLRRNAGFFDWVEDLGYEWDPVVPYAAGAPWPRMLCKGGKTAHWIGGNGEVTRFLYRVGGEKGAEFLFETPAAALVGENGRIVGVQAESNGQPLFVKAKKAVILAGGGFSNNREMLKKYVPTAYVAAGTAYDMPQNIGEPTRMGLGAGADLVGFNSYMAFDGGIPVFEMGLGPWHHFLYSGDHQIARQPWLHVNKLCERFMRISANKGFAAPQTIAQQPGGRAYVIFDSHFEEQFPAFGSGACSKPQTPDLGGMDVLDEVSAEEGYTVSKDWHVDFEKAVEKGAYKVEDTIEGVAEGLGLDPVKLKKTVERYNGYCADGKDPEFGKNPLFLTPILDPPFYGVPVGSQLFVTGCGLRVNPKMQVLDKNWEVIPGLYAAAQTAGGFLGESQMYKSVLSAAGLCFVTGYLAGDTAATEES